jgi:pimeloyl-ACP methyl ester carboxylesterase
MATFLIAHGAWSAGWSWKKMRPLIQDRGHELFTPTYTGVGERVHLAAPEIGLETHIADILGVLEFEDLQDVFLVGHSYGGMVATGVADRAPERLAHLIYLDAFVPRNGQSLYDLFPPEAQAAMREAVKKAGQGWLVPQNPLPPDTSETDIAWITPRRMMQPLKTFEQPVTLTGAVDRLSKTYVYCLRPGPEDVFKDFARRAQSKGWNYFEIDSSHSPHITAPEALAVLLDKIAKGKSA